MIIGTWNVNSIRSRLPRVLSWLERRQPAVACLQETKVVDENFPAADFEAAGYQVSIFGQKTYNGVAILSRHQITEIARNLPSDPPDADRRLLHVQTAGIHVINLYAPNGREVGHPMYEYKLDWYNRLNRYLRETFSPTEPVVLCGDFNIAPADDDVWDPALWEGQNLCSSPEREEYHKMLAWGFTDSIRSRHPVEQIFTWWDYRQGAFHRGWGLRIDHILLSPPLAARCRAAVVEREERKGEKPSDHAPVYVELE